MANYIEQYQYQPIAPANTNIDQIARTYQTKLAYWDQGAKEVKSAYQSALGLSLSRQDNQQGLQSFMQDAKQKIQQASTTDLSNGSNVADALGILDPLTDGKSEFSRNIMGDHMITQFYGDEIAKGESFRNGDKPDQYSDKNVTYLKNTLNDFTNAKSAGDWKFYYANRKGYSPYYDVQKEITGLMKEFDPSSVLSQRAKDGYIYTAKDASTLPVEVKKYLSSRLSDKAKRQLEIEGSVNFYGNENVLKTAYLHDANNDLNNLVEQKKSTDLKASLSNKTDAILLKHQSDILSDQIEQQHAQIAKMGDDDFFVKNRDHYAGKVQQNTLLDNVAIGMARTDVEQKMTPDTVWMQQSSQVFQGNMKKGQWAHDSEENALDRINRLQVAMIAHSGKKGDKGTGGTGNDNFSDASTVIDVPVSKEDKNYVATDPLTTSKAELDASMLQFTNNNPSFKAEYDKATTVEDKESVFNTFMAVKQKDLESADAELSTWQQSNPKATIAQIDERRKQLYTIHRVNDLMEYKNKLEVYNFAKKGEDLKNNSLIDKALSDVTATQSFDKDGMLVGNVNMPGKDYKAAITGENSLIQLKNINMNGKAININESQRKQILKEALLARLKNPDLNSKESLEAGLNKVIGNVTNEDADRAKKILESHNGFGSFIGSKPVPLNKSEYDIVSKAFPGLELKRKADGSGEVNLNGQTVDAALSQASGPATNKFDVYMSGHKIDVSDNTQWLYKRFDEGLSAYKSDAIAKADKQKAVEITDKQSLTRLRESHDEPNADGKLGRKYEKFYSLPDGSVYGTYVKKDKTIGQESLEYQNSSFAFTPGKVLLPKYQALNAFFTQSINTTQGVVFSDPITNSRNEQYRISFSNLNDGNYYNIDRYLPTSAYADKDGYVSVRHNEFTNMEQVQNAIEGK